MIRAVSLTGCVQLPQGVSHEKKAGSPFQAIRLHAAGGQANRRSTRDVRFGSLADISERTKDVRFTPESGHAELQHRRPLSAISGHGKIAWDLDQSPHERYQRQTAPHRLLLIGALTV